MPTSRLQSNEDARYDGYVLEDGEFIVYDRENPKAWITTSEPAEIRL